MTAYYINSKYVLNIASFSQIVSNNFLYLKEVIGLNHNIEEINRLLNSDSFMGYFIYKDSIETKNLVGYLIGEYISLNDGRYVYFINYFYMSSKHRSKGLGTQLMNYCIKQCTEKKGIKFIMLYCNSENNTIVNYYKKFGFIKDINMNEPEYTDLSLLGNKVIYPDSNTMDPKSPHIIMTLFI